MMPAPDFVSVNVPDAPVRESVTTFPSVPRAVKLVTVVTAFGKTMV